MILSELKGYLAQHGRADLTDLSNRFGVEEDALRGMLEQWIRKGRVRLLASGGPCGPCCGCGAKAVEIYEWVGTGEPH